ncbi:MAG TPA: hypothetical protein VK132_06060 [Gemmatimonadales bacterium]|nr:hypothetical protein [Gemmatimonadales bacterium]
MSTNSRTEARHPILDADGHRAEFPPLMREEFRRIVEKPAAEVLARGR